MRSLLIVLGACGFSAHAAPDGATASDGRSRDAVTAGDAPQMTIDASQSAEPYLLACDSDTLYRIDVDQQTATAIGSLGTYSIYGLAGNSTKLYAIPSQLNIILTIDPATGNVPMVHSLAPKRDYFGFAYAASQGKWYAGTDGMGEPDGGAAHLYTVDPIAGTTTIVGQFGGGLVVAGDLAWVEGKGLYGTFYGPACMSTTCIASIDPAHGTATVLTTSGPTGALSLSGFRGQLWALDTGGNIWNVDTTTGNAIFAFSTGVTWADAAN